MNNLYLIIGEDREQIAFYLAEILNKITPNNNNNKWVLKLSEIVQYSKKSSEQIFSTENKYFGAWLSQIAASGTHP